MDLLAHWSPLFAHVATMQKEQYYAYIQETQSSPLVIFPRRPLLEKLTRTHWIVIPVFWVTLMTLLTATRAYLWVTWYPTVGRMHYWVVSAPLGFAAWRVLEYVLHRWVFHSKYLPNLLHFVLHGIHHKTPQDAYRLVFPPIVSCLLGIILWNTINLVSHTLPLDAWGFFCGLVAGYVVYECIHYHVHHTLFAPNTFAQQLRKHHLVHHSCKSGDVGFGVSSPFLDRLLGTQTF